MARPHTTGDSVFMSDLNTRAQRCSVDLEARVTSRTPLPAVYTGFDPTADSLHVGNLLALVVLKRFKQHGYPVIALRKVGGATGGIGDPSGRSSQRPDLSWSRVALNTQSIQNQITSILQDGPGTLKVVNNLDWFQPMRLLDFLRDCGRHARVNEMINRESVRTRIESTQGISYLEFSYQLLQGYDFYHLLNTYDCRIQLGGSDQWGNILAGIDYIRRRTGSNDDVYGITMPLLVSRTGEKFGKSAGNAIWLDKKRTSVFEFYQYFIKTQDTDVEHLLKIFTFRDEEQINQLMADHSKHPEKRLAQRALAKDITELVHGLDATRQAEFGTRILFENWIENISTDELTDVFRGDQRLKAISIPTEAKLTDLLVDSGVFASKGEMKRMVKNGGVYVNGKRVTQPNDRITTQDFLEGKVLIVRKGKTEFYILHRE